MVGSGLYSARASAHATPHVIEMLFPDDGYVLVSNRGLIFGDKQRSAWRLMCQEALKINTSEQPSLATLPGGKLLVGTSLGLSTSSDQGCNWQGVEPFATTSVPALVRDPHASERLYLAAYANEADDKGGLYVSEDAGKNWQKLLAADKRDYVRSIVVAPSDAKRIYASGQSWDDTGKYTFYVTRSDDGGKMWTRSVVELVPMEEVELSLYSVHPKNPDLLTAKATNRSPTTDSDRLLVSRDGGKTWSSPLSMTLLSALAFSADGSKAWAVGQDGLFESRDDLKSFEKLGDATSMSYAIEREGQLLVAGYYNGFGSGTNGIGMMRAEPDKFESFMQLSDVSAPVACDAASETKTICEPWWTDWQRELMAGQFMPDAGVADAGNAGASAAGSGGSDAGAAGGAAGAAGARTAAAGGRAAAAGGSGGGDGGCGCAIARGSAPTRGLGLLAPLLGVGWVWRRRRSRRGA